MKKISKSHYLAQLNKYFPELDTSKARLIQHGWDHDVVVVEDMVFRFTKNQDYLHLLRKEIAVMNWLRPLVSIGLPHYDFIAKDGSFGRYPLLKGRELRKPIFMAFTEPARKRVATQLGKFLSALHKIPIQTAQSLGVKAEHYSKGDYEMRQNQIRKHVFPRLAPLEREWAEFHYEKFMQVSWEFQPVVIHSDLSDDHILVDEERGELRGVIDFADVLLGDPARDFAGLWEYGEDFVEEVLQHYTGVVDEGFLDRSKFPQIYAPLSIMREVLVNPDAHESLSFEKGHQLLKERMKEHPI